MNEADFAELRKHLEPLREVVLAFGDQHGFEFTRTGLYPRVRIDRRNVVVCYYDLAMSLDSKGQYRKAFTESVPYSLFSGAFYDVHLSKTNMTRYSLGFLLLDAVPFRSITPEILKSTLDKNLDRLLGITKEELEEHGEVDHIVRGAE